MRISNYARPGGAPRNAPATPGGSGGALGSVTDGVTTVSPATHIDFTSGATVTDLGAGVAGVDVGPADIVDIPTAETDTDLRLAPDGAGGVEWASGGGPGGGALVLLESKDCAGQTNVDFTSTISATYDEYQFELLGIVPSGNLVAPCLRFSTDGGANWDSTAAHYAYSSMQHSSGGSGTGGSQSATFIGLTYGGINTGDAAAKTMSGSWKLSLVGGGTYYVRLWGLYSTIYDSGYPSEGGISEGTYLQTTAPNAVRFWMNSGTFTAGTIRSYGIAKS